MPISSAVDASAVARVVGIKTDFVDLRGAGTTFLPQRIAVFGQGATASTYSVTKAQLTSAYAVGSTYGFGSPLHLAAKQLLPSNGDGVGTIPVTFYPLVDDGSGVAATGTITPSGAATGAASFVVKVNNIRSAEFTVANGDSVATMTAAITAAIAAILDLPLTAADGATVVNLTSKWKGVSANDLVVSVEATSEDNSGVNFVIVQPSGGLVNPDVTSAIAQIGGVWETLVLNCLDIADTTTLGLFNTEGEGRYGALVRKPFIVFTGNTNTTVSAATAVSDARKTDKINSQLVAPGSDDLPFVTAARELARIAVLANNNPPVDYGSQQATGLTPGTDAEQWTYADRDEAVKKGSSTIEVRDGVINLSDTVTFYHPDGDPTPAYRYAVDIVKIQNILFNLDLIFATAEWDGAPLVPDDEPTLNPAAKKPKTAKAAIAAMLDGLADNAIIVNRADAKAGIQAGINATNPKRLDVAFTVQLSGNTNIISIDFNFGFFFGG